MFVFERCCFVVEPTGEERRGGRGRVVVGYGVLDGATLLTRFVYLIV